jgi:hypothetical protein
VADFDVCGEDSGESRSRLVLLMRQTKQNCVRAVGRSEREWTGDWDLEGCFLHRSEKRARTAKARWLPQTLVFPG